MVGSIVLQVEFRERESPSSPLVTEDGKRTHLSFFVPTVNYSTPGRRRSVCERWGGFDRENLGLRLLPLLSLSRLVLSTSPILGLTLV